MFKNMQGMYSVLSTGEKIPCSGWRARCEVCGARGYGETEKLAKESIMIKGGQGRSARSLIDDAKWLGWIVLAMAAFALLCVLRR